MIINFKYKRALVLTLLALAFLLACVKDRNFEALEKSKSLSLIANASYSDVKNLFNEETLQIQEDLIIEGYVTSSDAKGNFFSVLHFQNEAENPTEGFRIEIDLRDAHLFYPPGSKIYIKLKGLYLGKTKDVFKLGGTFPSFGNLFIGRLPKTVIQEHIFLATSDNTDLKPTLVSLITLEKNRTNTLVQIDGLQIVEEELEQLYAEEREETERTLIDCEGNEIVLLNSGFSDFQKEVLPGGNGSIIGVLLRKKEEYQLAIRSLEDIDFSRGRCD